MTAAKTLPGRRIGDAELSLVLVGAACAPL